MKLNKTMQAAHTAAIETAGKALLEKMETAWKKCKEAEQAKRYKEAHEHEQMFTEFLTQLQKFPYVGLCCTVHYYSDHRAGQIVEVRGNRFKVQALKYTMRRGTNFFDNQYDVSDELDEQNLGWYSYRKCGKCYQVGSEAKYGNVSCTLGIKHTEIDPNF